MPADCTISVAEAESPVLPVSVIVYTPTGGPGLVMVMKLAETVPALKLHPDWLAIMVGLLETGDGVQASLGLKSTPDTDTVSPPVGVTVLGLSVIVGS